MFYNGKKLLEGRWQEVKGVNHMKNEKREQMIDHLLIHYSPFIASERLKENKVAFS